ncbi:isoprenoid synthase domain-containing protein [Cyathus striatus]|nr:isoprenoid synthase domain-containing protein [Cyathus striatus]
MYSNPIDTSSLPSYFTRLPVRIHKDTAAIDIATMDAIERCTSSGSKEYKQALFRHSNPFGNPYALVYPESNTEKMEYVVKVIEILSIHDDLTEEMTYEDAQQEHEVLRQGLHEEYDSSTETGKTVGLKNAYLREARIRMLSLDPVDTPPLLKEVERYIMGYDSSNENFKTLEEYLPFRIWNVGAILCWHSCRWAMGLHFTDEELQAIKDLEMGFGRMLALTNDYFSWEREKSQPTDRIRNAVPILMRQYSLGEKQAKLLLKGIIIEEEEQVKILRIKLINSEPSEDVMRYIDALELYVGGNIYWSATCPRYNKPQEELN